jgi:hypothetical protein
MSTPTTDPETQRCPICGQGVLVDLSFDSGAKDDDVSRQEADSRQIESFSCGHRVEGDRLSVADGDRLEVERRSADEGVNPES